VQLEYLEGAERMTHILRTCRQHLDRTCQARDKRRHICLLFILRVEEEWLAGSGDRPEGCMAV
jgi:hypothetical protein